MDRARAKLGVQVAGVVAALGALIASWGAAVIALRWVRLGAAGARFGLRLLTLRAYRRCPDCLRVLRREATVCRACGHRRARR